LSGKADIGIATEGLSQFDDLVSFSCYSWRSRDVVRKGTSLRNNAEIAWSKLASYPLINLDVGFTGRGHIDAAFKKGRFY